MVQKPAPIPSDPIDDDPASGRFRADIEELRSRLSAVVEATSEAADTIIAGIEDVIADGDAAQQRAFDALSACVFHDIVGQHVARAAELLAIIEKLGASQQSAETNAAMESLAASERRLSRLAHGPAIEGEERLGQSAIDDLFKE